MLAQPVKDGVMHANESDLSRSHGPIFAKVLVAIIMRLVNAPGTQLISSRPKLFP